MARAPGLPDQGRRLASLWLAYHEQRLALSSEIEVERRRAAEIHDGLRNLLQTLTVVCCAWEDLKYADTMDDPVGVDTAREVLDHYLPRVHQLPRGAKPEEPCSTS